MRDWLNAEWPHGCYEGEIGHRDKNNVVAEIGRISTGVSWDLRNLSFSSTDFDVGRLLAHLLAQSAKKLMNMSQCPSASRSATLAAPPKGFAKWSPNESSPKLRSRSRSSWLFRVCNLWRTAMNHERMSCYVTDILVFFLKKFQAVNHLFCKWMIQEVWTFSEGDFSH